MSGLFDDYQLTELRMIIIIIQVTLHNANSWGPDCSSYTEFRVRRLLFEWGNEGKVWESCTSYAIIRVINVRVKRSLLYAPDYKQ